MHCCLHQFSRSRCRRALYALLLGLLALLPVSGFADEFSVLLVLSDSAPPYQRFAQTFRRNLPEKIHVRLLEHAEVFSTNEKADLIVTVGVKAGAWVTARAKAPVLAAMLPSQRYAELLAEHPPAKQLSAIFVDQPWPRQVSLLRAALPTRKRIGLLYSPGTHLDIDALQHLLRSSGATLIPQSLNSSAALFDDLESVLSASDVLLAVPDSAIYNGNNIRNIMLSSYRFRVPLVGLSQAYVNAGALCAVFSTPEHLAAQASAVTLAFSQTGKLPTAQFPTNYSIAVNQEVAKMLGIRLQSAEQLKLQVERAEGGQP